MSKIKFKQIDHDTIRVSITSDTPMEMVQEMVKSLTSRGLVENLSKSTVSTRYFHRSRSSVDTVADKLIKSLEDMIDLSKAKKLPWWAGSQQDVDKWKTQTLPGVNKQPNAPKMNESKGPITTSGERPVMADSGAAGWTAGGSGKRYAFIKGEDVHKDSPDCKCDKCSLKRKEKKSLKKGWANHNSIPSAEEEIMKYAASINGGDDVLANQLAQMMNSKAMLGQGHNQPSSDEFIKAGEAMGLGTSENVAKNIDGGWNNAINNWLTEATKPISKKFSSEEEELEYWSNIKISDHDDGKSGY